MVCMVLVVAFCFSAICTAACHYSRQAGARFDSLLIARVATSLLACTIAVFIDTALFEVLDQPGASVKMACAAEECPHVHSTLQSSRRHHWHQGICPSSCHGQQPSQSCRYH
eukprot:6486735-Amphidinium_carterae.1